MESSMGPMVYFILSLIFGLGTIVTVVLTIIAFANSKKSKFIWLIVFLVTLTSLIIFVSLTVRSFVNKVKAVTSNVGQGLSSQVDAMALQDCHFADSVNSSQIKYLHLIEPEEFKGTVPTQFYNYLGYMDYYRMPLRYPFSLHCDDGLGSASLFDERNVGLFNMNDNGEIDCNVHHIDEFAFDQNILIVKKRSDDNPEDFVYLLYHFQNGKTESFTGLKDLEQRAKQLQFPKPINFRNCKEYFTMLQKQ